MKNNYDTKDEELTMNINEAKDEVKNAVRAYLTKDESGQYEIPVNRQRPVLLMGPPGIGKTAIMEQIAWELGIGLVSYTITHHTRQSAIGLPMISEKEYGGRKYSVTEYTMSEIIAAVYDQIEKSGVKEGILFLDEINCVSETLAPTMLQFLQYKTFGTHKLPDGYIIVTAGNPAKYNKSVRDFDIVTLDRVRQINIEEDFEAWKEYAYKAGVHGAILAYLEIKKDNFYNIRTELEKRSFVTARGWEDLSRVIKVHEKLGIEVDENLVGQYIQNADIASDFATYYELYHRYRELYKIPKILEGEAFEDRDALRKGSFDEKLSIIGLLVDKLMEEFRDYAKDQAVQKNLFGIMKEFLGYCEKNASKADAASEYLLSKADEELEKLEKDVEAGMVSRDDEKYRRIAAAELKNCAEIIAKDCDKDSGAVVKEWFNGRELARKAASEEAGRHLTNSLEFINRVFGDEESLSGSQEMVIFLTELSNAYYSLKFVRETGNDAYYKYNKILLLNDRRQELNEEIRKVVYELQ